MPGGNCKWRISTHGDVQALISELSEIEKKKEKGENLAKDLFKWDTEGTITK